MTTNYRSGSSVEYKVVKLFQSWGYEARRIAGSHGPFDVIAINRDDIILVQAKRYNKRRPNYTQDINLLASVEAPPNVQKYLAVWQAGRGFDAWIDVRTGREISWRNRATQSSAKRRSKRA